MNNPTESMRCPVCVVPLAMSERQGIEIDYCPQCRGVWLDRGELDKIIERNVSPPSSAQSASVSGFGRRSEPAAQPAHTPTTAPPAGGHHHHYYGHRKHWLVELFD